MAAVVKWRDPDWELGDYDLPDAEWPSWRDAYLKGKKIRCPTCQKMTEVVLRSVAHVFAHSCGHKTELPASCPP